MPLFLFGMDASERGRVDLTRGGGSLPQAFWGAQMKDSSDWATGLQRGQGQHSLEPSAQPMKGVSDSLTH